LIPESWIYLQAIARVVNDSKLVIVRDSEYTFVINANSSGESSGNCTGADPRDIL
jgi:hypothetical protein